MLSTNLGQAVLPDARRDLSRFIGLLSERIPFRFVRFSDGEMEIIRNEPLEITSTHLHWRQGSVRHRLPVYDVKQFDPKTGHAIRQDLLAAAKHRADRYFKGIPTAHNNAIADRDIMVVMNAGIDSYLTFSDLLINSNYRRFLRELFPILLDRQDVYVIGNFRMRPKQISPMWQHIQIPDNFFSNYLIVKAHVISALSDVAHGALVLSSASSLSNVIGHTLDVDRPDLTFVDVGTALHGQMGLESRTRDYHVAGLPWTFASAIPKLRYQRTPHYSIRW